MLDQKQIAKAKNMMSSAKSLPHLLPVERWNSRARSDIWSGARRRNECDNLLGVYYLRLEGALATPSLPSLGCTYGGGDAETTTANAAAVYSVTPSLPLVVALVVVRGRFMIQGMGMLPAEWRDGGGQRTAGRGRGYYDKATLTLSVLEDSRWPSVPVHL